MNQINFLFLLKYFSLQFRGASGLLWFISSFIFLFKYSLPMLKSGKETKRENIVMLLPLIMMITAIQVKYVVALNFSSKGGLPIVCQCISWILAGDDKTLYYSCV